MLRPPDVFDLFMKSVDVYTVKRTRLIRCSLSEYVHCVLNEKFKKYIKWLTFHEVNKKMIKYITYAINFSISMDTILLRSR